MKPVFRNLFFLFLVMLGYGIPVNAQNTTGPLSLEWATYLKATSYGFNNYVLDVAADSNGYVYLAGRCDTSFPVTSGAAQTIFGGTGTFGSDAFVLKLDTAGKNVVYATYIGGSDDDYANAICINKEGEVFITGHTASRDFPTIQGAYQPASITGHSAFVVKLSADGSTMRWSTYLGGSGDDSGEDIAINDNGEVFVAGRTTSPDFPVTSDALQPKLGGKDDAFIGQLDSTGGQLLFGTFFGGTDDEYAYGLALGNNMLAIAGRTSSADYPVSPLAYQKMLSGSQDAFVLRMQLSAKTIGYSTYLGGSGTDVANHVLFDHTGRALVTGTTASSDFPVSAGALQTTLQGTNDAFVTRFDLNGDSIEISTLFGGGGTDLGHDLAIAADSSYYLAGQTASVNLPTNGRALQRSPAGGEEVFVAHLQDDGQQIGCAGVTYIGGSGKDFIASIATVPGSGKRLALSVNTASPDFPATSGSYSETKINGSGYQPAALILNTVLDTLKLPFVTICRGDSTMIPAGDTAGTYSWFPSGEVSDPGIPSPWVRPTQETLYMVTGFDGNCAAFIHQAKVMISKPFVDAGRDTAMAPGGTIILNGMGGVTYQWSPPTGLSCTRCPNPKASPDTTATYYLVITDSIGCTALDSVRIFVAYCNEEDIRIPNVFTPNNDGLNDDFGVEGLVQTMQMTVFNRWGNVVFRSDDKNALWDGMVAGAPAKEGTYYVIAEGACYGSGRYLRRGYLTLIR